MLILETEHFGERFSLLSPRLSKTSFVNKNFQNRESFHYNKFWYCETSQMQWNIVIATPLLSPFFFDTRNILKHQKDALGSVSVWTATRDTPPPPLLSIKTLDTWNFLNDRSNPPRNISVQWDYSSDGRSWFSSPVPPLLSIIFLTLEVFWNTEGYL